MIPDLTAVFRLIDIAQTFESGLRGIDHQEVVQDLRDLHQLMEGIRRRYGTMEDLLRSLDGLKPR